MEGDYRGQKWTTWFLWKEDLRPSDIRSLLYEICGQKTPARSTAFNWAGNFHTGKETAQAAVHECCQGTSEEWFCEAIQKVPRRWQ
jgi:hypothetical protein